MQGKASEKREKETERETKSNIKRELSIVHCCDGAIEWNGKSGKSTQIYTKYDIITMFDPDNHIYNIIAFRLFFLANENVFLLAFQQ